jgi:DNA-binding LacI/PurR family transcriptional regulator
LNNDHRITPETRRRIQAAAGEMGYRPSVALSSFASKDHWTNRELRASPIAVLYGGSNPPEKMRNYEQLNAAATERGFRVEWRKLNAMKDLEGLDRELYNQGFQGIILGTNRFLEPGWPSHLDLSRFAVVSTDIIQHTEPLTVFHDAARRAVLGGYRRLRERGCRRIGAALWRAGDHPDHGNRLGAFFCAQMEATGGFDPACLLVLPFPGEAPEAKQHRLFREWIQT